MRRSLKLPLDGYIDYGDVDYYSDSKWSGNPIGEYWSAYNG
jgi:hypothetical protein